MCPQQVLKILFFGWVGDGVSTRKIGFQRCEEMKGLARKEGSCRDQLCILSFAACLQLGGVKKQICSELCRPMTCKFLFLL